MKGLSHEEWEDIKSDLRNMANSKGFEFLLSRIMEECVQELIQADVGGLTAAAAHARMKVLAELPPRIKSLIDSDLMVLKQGRRR